MSRTTRTPRWPIAILLSTLCACSGAPPEEPPQIRPVRWLEVARQGAQRERSFSGTARAGLESQLSFRVAGTLEAVAVTVGGPVRKGQEIARLEPTDYELRVQQAEASLAQARAAERKTDGDYQRVRGLYENNNAAKSDLDAARAQAESTRAQVEAAEQQLELARRQLGYTRLLAPVAGAIAAVTVEEGENVQAGQPVALLASGALPEVEVAMPEALIAQVHEGDEVSVSFDALPGVVCPATVTEVGVAATSAGTTFPVKVRLASAEAALRSGMAATVTFSFTSDAAAAGLWVPAVAVGEDREGRFVFVLEAGAEEGLVTARRRAVTVGELGPAGIEILGGLEPGERIATAGVRRLRDGQVVRLLAASGAVS